MVTQAGQDVGSPLVEILSIIKICLLFSPRLFWSI